MAETSITSTGTCAEMSSYVAVTIAFPAFFATRRPPGSAATTSAFDELQDGVAGSRGCPFLSRTRAVRRAERSIP